MSQNWSLVCALIEIVVETITIAIYAITFWRIRSKRKLTKVMDTRDKARSDLYLAQLRMQSAPNTPGFRGLKSAAKPSFGAHVSGPELEKGGAGAEDVEYARRHELAFGGGTAGLAPGPRISVTGATPVVVQDGFEEREHGHFAAVEGEQLYESVPIPGQYAPTAAENEARDY